MSLEQSLLSSIFENSYNVLGGGRDEKKDYWAILKQAKVELYDKDEIKTFSAQKVKEQMQLLDTIGIVLREAMSHYDSKKKTIEARLEAKFKIAENAYWDAKAKIPYMKEPFFYEVILLRDREKDAKYDKYLEQKKAAEQAVPPYPQKPELVFNTPDGSVFHQKWCHIFAINKLHESFVRSRKLDVVYTAARRRERTAKVAAYENDARRGSASVRENLLATLPKEFPCPYCAKKTESVNSEADHIHPVTKGGLTVPTNMVMVCEDCNRVKSADTLRQFCKKTGKDFNKVCDRLEKLGKDI